MTIKAKTADSAAPTIITPAGFEKTIEGIKHGAESATAGMEHVQTNIKEQSSFCSSARAMSRPW